MVPTLAIAGEKLEPFHLYVIVKGVVMDVQTRGLLRPGSNFGMMSVVPGFLSSDASEFKALCSVQVQERGTASKPQPASRIGASPHLSHPLPPLPSLRRCSPCHATPSTGSSRGSPPSARRRSGCGCGGSSNG